MSSDTGVSDPLNPNAVFGGQLCIDSPEALALCGPECRRSQSTGGWRVSTTGMKSDWMVDAGRLWVGVDAQF